MVLTGADGQLKFANAIAGKIRDWTLTVTKDAIEDTCIGDLDRTYVEGLRGASGSCTVLYDPESQTSNDMLNSIFQNGQANAISFVLSKKDNRQFTCNGFITSVGPSVAVGAASAVSVNFQVSGRPDGVF